MSPLEMDYANMVAALAKPGDQIVRDLTPFMAHCWHMASCIQGEAGELFDAIKKPAIYAKGEIDRANVVEEFGDLEFYMEGLRQRLGITREETLLANREKLLTGKNARYKSGTYSNEQALARADKQEPEMPVHHVSHADAGVMFSHTRPSKSAEGTSPMEQPGALSPEGASGPPASVPSTGADPGGKPMVSPGEPVTDNAKVEKRRLAKEHARHCFEEVQRCMAKFAIAVNALEKDAGNARLRRKQQQAANELSQAQYALEQSFDMLPPDKE